MISKTAKYPLATLVPYGPNDKHATKLVVAIFPRAQREPELWRKWFVEAGDVRANEKINEEVTAYLKEHQVVEAVMADRIVGCPHEEGIDYPQGEACPECPFWANSLRLNRKPLKSRDTLGRNDACSCESGKKFKRCCALKT